MINCCEYSIGIIVRTCSGLWMCRSIVSSVLMTVENGMISFDTVLFIFIDIFFIVILSCIGAMNIWHRLIFVEYKNYKF